MSLKASATVNLKFSNQKQLDALLAALKPEAQTPPTHRSTVQLKAGEGALTLNVAAEDTVALRATLNAYLRWVQSILNVLETVQK